MEYLSFKLVITLINSERLPFWQRARDQILNKEKQEILQEENEGYDTDYTYKSICFIDGKPIVVNNLDFALGRFRNAINISGWSYLEIETKGDYDPGFQAYAAGYIEGIANNNIKYI
uniref:Phospholipase B-like n=1 Tax=Meloidogyne floridensis TaxID=298350 RepID=A0A915NPR2_9BILA